MYKLNIKPKSKIIDTTPSLYGLFFEDINRAGDGGLYAELLRNRAFDDGIIPEGCSYDKNNKLITSPTGWTSSFDCFEEEGIAAWTCINGAKAELIKNDTLNVNRKRALQLQLNGGAILNDGFKGVPVKEGENYKFFMFAKSNSLVKVSVMLTSSDGKKIYTKQDLEISGDYKKYECQLLSSATDFDGRLAIYSESSEKIILGFTSLFPAETFMGRENGLRKELAQRLLDLKPAFLRFPGGCIVEGFSKETAYRFKDSIGPVWERKPHWLLWSYMTTNGLGFHEYLQFCEDAKIDAMYVFNCGMTCQGRCPDYFDENLIEEFFQDAVDAIEYATAPADSFWGKKRAENGHPEPFTVLKYLEIGNENWGDEYFKRYEKFYTRLKKLYPDFIYISTDHSERVGLKTEFVDEHFYSDPIFFAANTKLYDDLDPSGINIYCGEYASTIGCKEGTLYGALGEAAFLTGIERNQNKVRMTSYAPLFKNVDYVSWEPDMIIFNNHENYVIPSYYMLKMFAENRGEYVCECNVITDSDRRLESGHFTDEQGNIFEGQCFTKVYENAANLHIKFWDRGTFGEDQNHYDLIIENGNSKIVHFNGWSQEVICKEKSYNLPSGKIKVEIQAKEDWFKICINEKEIYNHTLGFIPHISAVSTVDTKTNELITKIVNFSENKIDLNLETDVLIEQEAQLTVLSGSSYSEKNTFEKPENVKSVNQKLMIGKDNTISILPRSVNVLRQKM